VIGFDVPRWLDALVGLQVGAGFFLGWIAFLGWLILRIGGPWVARSEARLARDRAGAERYGWRPAADTDGMLAAAGYRCFGHSGEVSQVLAGDYEGRPIRIAEFRYIGRSKIPTTNVTHLIAIELPVRLPELVVSHQTVLDPTLLSFAGESGAFNRLYYVASPDHRYSSAVMHPRMMEWLLAHELDFRISGPLLVAYSPTPWTVRQTLATLPVLSGVAGLIPPFVLDDFGRPLR